MSSTAPKITDAAVADPKTVKIGTTFKAPVFLTADSGFRVVTLKCHTVTAADVFIGFATDSESAEMKIPAGTIIQITGPRWTDPPPPVRVMSVKKKILRELQTIVSDFEMYGDVFSVDPIDEAIALIKEHFE